MANPTNKTCPEICPASQVQQNQEYKDAGSERTPVFGPYVPGFIQPPTPTWYPAGAPPPYLPQISDSTSGDILTMSPIDPWAPGHMDWNAQSGMTGVRPVHDRYSITRYSTGAWRKKNKFMLEGHVTQEGRVMTEQTHKEIDETFKQIKNKEDFTNKKLDERIKEVCEWKKRVEKCQQAMAEELEALEVDRARLKKASQILMIPEAISQECLELRTHRYEPDQVRDLAEQELIREVAIVSEIRSLFNRTLRKADEQVKENRFAKAAIEMDWTNKKITLAGDKLNREMSSKSSHLLQHPGVNRWTENSTSLDFWLHYCKEIIKNTDEVRDKSRKLRDGMMASIVKGGKDMKTQSDRTNMALNETINATELLVKALEDGLKDNLERIADIEKLMDYLMESLRELDKKSKLCMSRLQNRNYERPNVENCRDEAQYALMDEIKFTREKADEFKYKLRQADTIRAKLMKFRGDLEKDIAGKRKALYVDGDRLQRIRAHMPSAETFANI